MILLNKIRQWLKGVINKLISKKSVKQALNIDIAVSDEMFHAINLWSNMYKNLSPWINDNTSSLNLAAAISSEVARYVTIEMESEITGSERADFLNKSYQVAINSMRNYVEYACAKGGVIFKPSVENKNIVVNCVGADDFYPIAFNSQGQITSAVFADYLYESKKVYTRLECHSLQGKNYRITNTLYVSNINSELGNQIPLSSIEKWANLLPEVNLVGIDKPLFSYFKMPLANTIDTNSPLGISIFARAIDLIKEADKQYSSLLWEYRGSELAIDASADLFKLDKNGKPLLPFGKERLFRCTADNLDPDKPFYNVFSPTIRDESLINGLNELFKRIEFNCGLSYGILSDPQKIALTATEIVSSKQRFYSTITDIQKSLQTSLEDLIYSMNLLIDLYNLSPKGTYEVSFNFDDSIIVTKEEKLKALRDDALSGLIKPELYISKKYGVSLEEAQNLMPQQIQNGDDDFE